MGGATIVKEAHWSPELQEKQAFVRQVAAAAIVVIGAILTVCGVATATVPPPGYFLQETITVPTDNSTVSSTTVLASAVTYKLRATGTFVIADSLPCRYGDAEFDRFEADNTCTFNPSWPVDFDGAYDIGIGINSPTTSNSKGVTWSTTFNPTHEYTIDFIGLGAPISLNYHDNYYPDNSGSLTVEVFAPIPAVRAPMLGGWAQILLFGGLLAGGLRLLWRRVPRTHFR